MAKTISHYRHKFESVAGQHAKVAAWRDENGEMSYRVGCRLCNVPGAGLRWESNHPTRVNRRLKARGKPTLNDDFVSVMRRWVIHMKVAHINFATPVYNLGEVDETEWEREERLLTYYKDQLMEWSVLERLFEK